MKPFVTRIDCLKKNVLLLFISFSVLVANPKKTTLHGGQSRSWSAGQGISFRLPLTSLCDLPLLFFVYFQVNNGVLYFLDYEDELHHGPLCSRFNVVVDSYL